MSQYSVLVSFLTSYLREELFYFLSELIALIQRPCQIVNLFIGPLVLVPHDPLVLFHRLLGGDVVAPHFGELLVDLHIELCLELRQIVIHRPLLQRNSC